MVNEIERKFLVADDSWVKQVRRRADYRQGYLTRGGDCSIRIRVGDGKANLNIKSATIGIIRQEYEYPIPLAEANEMLATLCTNAIIEKTRNYVEIGSHTWEIDVFKGENEGLIVAEIELQSIDETFELPAWAGAEVSDESRYFNAALIDNPYTTWSDG